jgi:hypothetical protein
MQSTDFETTLSGIVCVIYHTIFKCQACGINMRAVTNILSVAIVLFQLFSDVIWSLDTTAFVAHWVYAVHK